MDNVVATRRAAEPCDSPWSQLDWPALYNAIGELKPDDQTLLTLRFFEDMDYDEIGRIMDTKPGTIRVTLHRLLRKLQEGLAEDLGGGA